MGVEVLTVLRTLPELELRRHLADLEDEARLTRVVLRERLKLDNERLEYEAYLKEREEAKGKAG